MANALPLIFITLSLLIVRTNAFSFVNNVTVPSDILTKMFFDEIQQNPNFLNSTAIQNIGNYNADKCKSALREIVSRFPNLDVLPFIDAWGKFPAGILYGHLQDLGNFDQCTKISTQISDSTGLVNGQYCFASIPLTLNQAFDIRPMVYPSANENDRALLDGMQVSIAICSPDTCDPDLLKEILQNAADKIFNGALSGINVNRCTTAKKPDFEAINIAGIVIFSIFAALMLLSTAYDVYAESLAKPAVPLLLAFSVLTNGRKLFAISTTKSPNSIDCLTGMRVLSMFWVMLCHDYMLFAMLKMINSIDLKHWAKAWTSMHILMGTLSVDTFFLISGLLIAWLGFRELDKRKGKLNVLMMYLHRYLRLTPAVAAVILFYLSINQYIGSGPYRETYIDFHDDCKTKWWSTLLYIQNYVNTDNICIKQSWYLAVDTQLYVVSPLILIPLWKWGRKFAPIMVVLSLLSLGCIIATYYAEDYHFFVDTFDNKQVRLIYQPTHTRYSVWLIGIGLGYFMHKNRGKSIRPAKWLQMLGWIVCFSIILGIIYGPYFSIHSGRTATVFEAAIFQSLKRIGWALGLSWIVLACHYGYGGVVNTFLAHPWWQPLGRLTYSMYLVHMAVQTINLGITRTDVYFSDYTQILLFWSTFGMALLAAIVLTLAFESPILVIEKSLLGGSKGKKTHADIGSTVTIDTKI